MDSKRKPLAKAEGRRRMRRSGLTIAWHGTADLDDWVAYIVGTKSKKSVLADHASERKVKTRSEEHTSELQSRLHLVCRLLLEKKKKQSDGAVSGGAAHDAR